MHHPSSQILGFAFALFLCAACSSEGPSVDESRAGRPSRASGGFAEPRDVASAFGDSARPGCSRSMAEDLESPDPQLVATDTRVQQILLYNDAGKYVGFCTGSFYSSRTLVIAGHCLKNPLYGTVAKIELASTGETSTDLRIHPQYKPGTLGGILNGLIKKSYGAIISTATDVAVVQFKSCFRETVRIGPRPEPGDELSIAGFGQSADDPSRPGDLAKDRKRSMKTGTITVETVTEFITSTAHSMENGDTVLGMGDSGGSVFDADGNAVGIVSAGQAEPANLMQQLEMDPTQGSWKELLVDLNRPEVQTFLEAFIED